MRTKIRAILAVFCLLAMLGGFNWHSRDIIAVPKQQTGYYYSEKVFSPASKKLPKEFVAVPKIQDNGDFRSIWSGLLSVPEVLVPIDVEYTLNEPVEYLARSHSELFAGALQSKEGSFKTDSDKTIVFYTDEKLLTRTTQVRSIRIKDFFKAALFDPNVSSVICNPTGKFMEHKLGLEKTIKKNEIPSILGLLEIGDLELDRIPYSKLALASAAAHRPYEVLYFWQQSLTSKRSGEDWTEVFLTRIETIKELNYPGAFEQAKHEMQWFINKNGANTTHFDVYKQLNSSPTKYL